VTKKYKQNTIIWPEFSTKAVQEIAGHPTKTKERDGGPRQVTRGGGLPALMFRTSPQPETVCYDNKAEATVLSGPKQKSR
jgi:hypothetical protein